MGEHKLKRKPGIILHQIPDEKPLQIQYAHDGQKIMILFSEKVDNLKLWSSSSFK